MPTDGFEKNTISALRFPDWAGLPLKQSRLN
jgi:hypothetical protein